MPLFTFNRKHDHLPKRLPPWHDLCVARPQPDFFSIRPVNETVLWLRTYDGPRLSFRF